MLPDLPRDISFWRFLFKNINDYILNYIGFEQAASHTGTGRLVLIVNQETKNIEGLSEFTMPETPTIPISVTKGSLSNGRRQLRLTFDQPDRVMDIDSRAFTYRAVPLTIDFEKESGSESYRGELKISVRNVELKVANTTLAAETAP